MHGPRENRFYSSFDRESLGGERRSDYRTPFQVDRDRIIHSHGFRKLQSKTQVFLSGEYDFYRTRLTHSIEVAQIGRSICAFLASRGDPLDDGFFIDSDLVEAVCLAHDIGHPPFGHAGERTLQELMAEHGGFEGNAQTLRLITEILYQTEASVRGIQPTRGLLDGVLKYKALYGEYPGRPENHFLYDSQACYRGFVLDGRSVPAELGAPAALNAFRSIECQIMDWADDAAYSLNDIVDGVKVGFLNLEAIERWAGQAELSRADQAHTEKLLLAIREDRLESVFSIKIGDFIQACRLKPRSGFMSEVTHRYAFDLEIEPERKAEAKFYKRLAKDLLYDSPQLQQLEHKGRVILSRLFSAFWDNYGGGNGRSIKVLPTRVARLVGAEADRPRKVRLICDHLAGLTDSMAMRTYKRFFDPDFGSIRDLG